MQGYVCVNSIYVYLIQNLEKEPQGIKNETESQEVGLDFEISTNPQKSEDNLVNKLFVFHQQRINRILSEISQQKRKQLKLKYEHKKILAKI
jgi:uncharacterized membrane protein